MKAVHYKRQREGTGFYKRLYLVIFVLVLELGDHGNGVLGLRIVDDSNVKPVERHEGDLAGEFLLVHLLQDLSADLKKVLLLTNSF
jgi:hypothetical protein